MNISSTLANNLVQVYKNLIDGGNSAAKLRLYSGTVPANVNTTPAGTLLVELVFNDPCGVITNNVLTLSINSALATETGTCTFARILNSENVGLMDLIIPTDLTISPNPIIAGTTISVNTAKFTQ